MCLVFAGVISCQSKQPIVLFSALNADSTGIHFVNHIDDTGAVNILDYLYYYNGAGVAIGDFNNDSLPDIYLVSNTASNSLYINEGNFHFKDITKQAGVAGTGNWNTGVTLVDVNADGYLDIYLSAVGGYLSFQGRNQLFINNGKLGFTEEAMKYGLDITGFNTQAEFFDYDLDGDLDMFLVNHSVHSSDVFQSAEIRTSHNNAAGDKLFRNDLTSDAAGFIEVTKQAGIFSSVLGYGLNVSIADMNRDGWPDIYVTNDFHENDYYYLNNRNGTFSEMNQQAFAHESRFSMGSDIADLNNDGWPDIITLDMLPEDEKILKSSAGDDPWDIFNMKYNIGYHYQLSRNCLQLNTGKGMHFSEIGLYAGIAATDWSWAPLAADFDNDGIKDIFVTNGILRRPNDLDFIKFNSLTGRSPSPPDDKKIIEHMPDGAAVNYLFKGTDSLRFIDKSLEAGLKTKGYSSGAAYADLDNDGDLDLVINNMNAKASVFRNNTRKTTVGNFLQVKLKGNSQNPFGIGAEISIRTKNHSQYAYMNCSKGFLSSSLQYLHFGIGADSIIDEITVTWKDKMTKTLRNISANQRLYISQDQAKETAPSSMIITPALEDITGEFHFSYRHKENNFNDFSVQPFIPYLISRQGPAVAVADVNGDGREDIFAGGARNQSAGLFIQEDNDVFIKTNDSLFIRDAGSEDVDALFFDADQDGDQDLYVVSGGNENSSLDSRDRLYMNDGMGKFKASKFLPSLIGTKSVVTSADFNRDGLPDLFIGGRSVAGSYGEIPVSYLLINEGTGKFRIAEESEAAGLSKIGMVTDASWVDFDNDTWPDLVVVGEWMPVTIYKNHQGKLTDFTNQAGITLTKGLWQHLQITDLDKDGYYDLVAGNLGENTKLKASIKHPLCMYMIDYPHTGKKEPIVAYCKDGKYYTMLLKEEIERQLPAIKKKYLNYSDFAGMSVEQIFGDEISYSPVLTAHTLSTTFFINDRKGKFKITSAPFEAQYGTVFSSFSDDFNKDGFNDLLLAGNLFGVAPFEGRYDGLMPMILRGVSKTKTANFSMYCNLNIKGEVRHIKKITLANNREAFIFAINNQSLRFLSIDPASL